MAIYSCSVEPITRSQGHSIVAASAYRARRKMNLEITGESWDYSSKKDLVANDMLLPNNNNQNVDPMKVWNELEQKETRKADGLIKANAELGREIRIALPRELDSNQNTELTRRYCQQLSNRYNCVVEFGIHNDRGNKNPHAHILISSREYDLNKGFGNKIRSLSAFKTRKQELEHIRKSLADYMNADLERYGFNSRVDHRSLEAQQKEAEAKGDYAKAFELSREPTKHVGRKPKTAQKNIAFNMKVKADQIRRAERLINRIELDITKQLNKKQASDSRQTRELIKRKPKIFQSFNKAFLNFLQIDFFGIEKREKLKEQEIKEQQADFESERKLKEAFAKKSGVETRRHNKIKRENEPRLLEKSYDLALENNYKKIGRPKL